MLHMLVVRRTYRVYIAFIPMYADVNIRVYIAQKEVDICSTQTYPFTIEIVCTYILYIKVHLTQKKQSKHLSLIHISEPTRPY